MAKSKIGWLIFNLLNFAYLNDPLIYELIMKMITKIHPYNNEICDSNIQDFENKEDEHKNSFLQLNQSDYRRLKTLGKGSYGKVDLV